MNQGTDMDTLANMIQLETIELGDFTPYDAQIDLQILIHNRETAKLQKLLSKRYEWRIRVAEAKWLAGIIRLCRTGR